MAQATPTVANDTEKRSQLARQRWLILRNALLSSERKSEGRYGTPNEASIHRFPGFQPHLLPRHSVRDGDCRPSLLNDDDKDEYEFVEYVLPLIEGEQEASTHEERMMVRTREKRRGRREHGASNQKPLSAVLEDLTCHRRLGIDNTGSVCVWDSEAILTHWLLSSPSSILPTTPRRVVELGCGMAGIAGMALYLQRNHVKEVLLTDGHHDAVQNNQVCIQLTQQTNLQQKRNASLRCQQLLWTDDRNDSQKIWDESPFDLCLVSDCLHFTHFHSALLITLARLLTIGGVAILCQPERGTSLQQFCQVVESVNSTGDPLMSVDFLEPHHHVQQLHEHFLRSHQSYDANIHYPVLLQLQKLREVDLIADVAQSRSRMEQNDVKISTAKSQTPRRQEERG